MKKHTVGLLALGICICLSGCKSNVELDNHTFSETWSYDESFHWHEATCEHTDEVSGFGRHSFGEWTVTKEATLDEDGSRQKICKKCKYELCESIPRTIAGRTETTYDANDGHKTVTEYNIDGIRLRCTEYNLDGTKRSVSNYDSHGKRARYTHYKSDGSVLTQYQAEPDNYIIIWTHMDGTPDYISEYDSKYTKIKTTYYKKNGFINYITEYDDNSNIKITSYFTYNEDGSVNSIEEHDESGNKVKTTYYYYNADDTINYLEEYDSLDNLVKSIYYHYNADGSLNHIDELNDNNKKIKITYYNSDSSVFIQYQADEGNYIGVDNNSYVNTINITEYDNSGKIIAFTSLSTDGSILIQYQADEGNYIGVDINSYVNTINIYEYDNSGRRLKKTGYYSDGSVEVKFYDNNNHVIKYILYNRDGSISVQYQADEGNYIEVDNNSYDNTINITEYDNSDRRLKETGYYSDGSVQVIFYGNNYNAIKYILYNRDSNPIIQYQAADGNRIDISNVDSSVYITEYDNYNIIKNTIYNKNGSISNGYDFIYEKDSSDRIIKVTRKNADGSISVQHKADEGNYIEVFDDKYNNILYVSEYDNSSRRVKGTHYHPDGYIGVELQNKYGYTSKYILYNRDGSPIIQYQAAEDNYCSVSRSTTDGSVSIEEYDSNYKLIKITYYNNDGSMNYGYIFEKDSTDNIVKVIRQNADGAVSMLYQAEADNYLKVGTSDSYISITECDNKNYVYIKRTYYYSDGSVGVNLYDNNYNVIKYILYTPKGNPLIQYQAEEGNRIETRRNDADGSVSIEEYDSNYKLIKTTYYNKDGSIRNE